MKKQREITILAIIFVLLIIVLSGCGSSNKEINEPGEAKIKEYPLNKLETGAYIQKNKKDVFIEFMSKGKGYEKSSLTTSPEDNNTRIVWFANQDELIPEVTQNDQIILITDSQIPPRPQLYPMEDYGYTIGCTLYEDQTTGTWALSKNKYRSLCTGSTFNQNFKDAKNNEDTRLFDIGGKKITQSNVSTVGSITGLERGKEYPIGLYNGTIYNEITAVCDTHLFVNAMQSPFLTENYQFTKDGYIIVPLPEDLPGGYYYFDDIGLFKYTKTTPNSTE